MDQHDTAKLVLSTLRHGEPPPKVSVAVSSYERPEAAHRLLEALAAQTLPPSQFEVVLVDNASTRPIAIEAAAAQGLQLLLLRVESNRGPARGRNVAWRNARADVIAFTDDDCVPTPGWLESGLEAMAGRPSVCIGRTVPNPDQWENFGPFSRTIRVRDNRLFETCNVFYARADLETVDGFDENFTTPGGEDTELGVRVCELGREARFVSDALVLHDIRPSSFRTTVRETMRWTDLPLLVARHPKRGRAALYRRWFWKSSHALTILGWIGIGLAPLVLPSLVMILPWVYQRTIRRPVVGSIPRRIAVLLPRFAIDTLEVMVMIRGSIRHRTILL